MFYSYVYSENRFAAYISRMKHLGNWACSRLFKSRYFRAKIRHKTFYSVCASVRISCHLNSVYILSHSQIALMDLIGHMLQIRNKNLKFSFLLLGSNVVLVTLCPWKSVYIFRRRKMIFYYMSYGCSVMFRIFFMPRGQMRVDKRFPFSVKFVT